MKDRKYKGINRFLQSDAVQTILDKRKDGTFSEFLGDWKWIFGFSKKYRLIVVLYTVVGVFGSTLSLGAAYVGRILVNIVVEQQKDQFWLLISAMLGMTAFSLLLSSVSNRIFTRISIYVNNDIQASIFDSIIDAKWADLSRYPSGDLLNRFNGDVGTISSNAIGWIPNLIVNIYTLIATLIVLFRLDYIMALIAMFSAPFLLVMSRYIMRRLKEYREKVLELNSGMMSFEAETFYHFDIIKSFGIIGYHSRMLRSLQKKYKDLSLDYNKFEIKSKILLTLVSTVVSMAAFGYCLFRLWSGRILYGDMTFFLQQRSGLSSRFNNLIGTIPGMLNSAVSAHRIRELVDLPREDRDPALFDEINAVAKDGLTVKLHNVSFAYMQDKPVYSHLDFEAKPGEIIAVLASSGGGKTTLMRVMLGMLDPQDGKVSLTGSDGREVPVNADLRRFFAYVPQGNTVLSGTVADNMRMVREDATDEEIVEALKTACAWEFVEKLPEGINSTLGERGRGISEGQAQRISIARALIRNSPILLLDEATSALDMETEEQVLENIIRRHPDKVIIISTHRPGALRLCQRIYRIENGAMRETDLDEALRVSRAGSQSPRRKPEAPDIPDKGDFVPGDKTAEELDTIIKNSNENWWGI